MHWVDSSYLVDTSVSHLLSCTHTLLHVLSSVFFLWLNVTLMLWTAGWMYRISPPQTDKWNPAFEMLQTDRLQFRFYSFRSFRSSQPAALLVVVVQKCWATAKAPREILGASFFAIFLHYELIPHLLLFIHLGLSSHRSQGSVVLKATASCLLNSQVDDGGAGGWRPQRSSHSHQ